MPRVRISLILISDKRKQNRYCWLAYCWLAWLWYILDMSPPSLVPERATYGFVSCLLCYVSFGIYLVWAYIPRSYQEWLGLTYWPNKFFAVAIPPFLCVLFLVSFVIYEGFIFINTAPVDSPDILSNSQKEDFDNLPAETITPIEELSIIDVNKALYSTWLFYFLWKCFVDIIYLLH